MCDRKNFAIFLEKRFFFEGRGCFGVMKDEGLGCLVSAVFNSGDNVSNKSVGDLSENVTSDETVGNSSENVSGDESVGNLSEDVSGDESVRNSTEDNVVHSRWENGFEGLGVSDEVSRVRGDIDDWGGDNTGKTVNRWDGEVFVADLWSDQSLDAVAGLGDGGGWEDGWDDGGRFNDWGLDVGVWGLDGLDGDGGSVRNSGGSVDGVDGVKGGEGVKSSNVSRDGVDSSDNWNVDGVKGVKSSNGVDVVKSDNSAGVHAWSSRSLINK